MLKKLVVNADDLGLSMAINRGIFESHVDGIVTSTSAVASGQAFDEAIQECRRYPNLGVGVHLTLVEENAVAKPSAIPTLAPDGLLPSKYGKLIKGVASGKIRILDIEIEFRAQIEKCMAAGLKLTHLDSHQHTHALPQIFRVVVRLANEYGIGAIRIPRGWPTLSDLSADRFAAKCVLCLLAHSDALLFRQGSCRTTQRFAGLFESGALTEERLLKILTHLREGTTELVCHPGCNDPSPKYASWNSRRQMELASLLSLKAKGLIQSMSIQLVNYSGI